MQHTKMDRSNWALALALLLGLGLVLTLTRLAQAQNGAEASRIEATALGSDEDGLAAPRAHAGSHNDRTSSPGRKLSAAQGSACHSD
ncbi:MAG: hypothetical protein P8189_31495 [Anaerolineae bacterium]|jgi:hypothetical protein